MDVVHLTLFEGIPYVFGCALLNSTNSAECPHTGIFTEYIEQILSIAGYSYEDHPNVPSYFDKVTERWNGSFTLIMNGSIDMFGYFMIQTPFREKYFDFSYPIFTEKPFFIVHKKEPTLVTLAQLPLRPFDRNTWLAILGTVAVLVSILYAFGVKTKEKIWNLSVIAINISQDYLRENWIASHVILAMFGLFVTLYVNLYQGTLLTYLLHPPDKIHFSDWKQMMDMIETKQFNLIASTPTYWYLQAAENSNNPYFVRLRKALSVNPAVIEPNESKIVEMVKSGPYLFPVRSISASYLASIDCDLDLVKGGSLPTYVAAFATTKNSSLLPMLNRQILKSYGLISRLIEKYLSSSRQCEYEKKSEKTHVVAINLLQLAGLGLLYVVGHLLAAGYFIWERYRTSKRQTFQIEM